MPRGLKKGWKKDKVIFYKKRLLKLEQEIKTAKGRSLEIIKEAIKEIKKALEVLK